MTRKHTVRLTASFEHNLEEIEAFLSEAETPGAFDALLEELTETVIPNLGRFPGIGRSFLQRPARSAEAINGINRLAKQLNAITKDGELREYVMAHYILLYAQINEVVYVLSIRHQKQLSFDFQALWNGS